MYRVRIRESYDQLSRSYRKVADFIMSNYYEVSFMTAAQLAYAVGVDTTTVVRFSQRLSYGGYPQLLSDIRDQVKAEIYAAYQPPTLTPDDPAATFIERLEQERQNISQTLIQNPPDHIRETAKLVIAARRVLLIAEGYADTVAIMVAQQLRHRGIPAEAAEQDSVKRAATLTSLTPDTLVIGISSTQYGEDVARALAYARGKGCATLGIVGSLASPVNRMSDRVVYAPTDAGGPLPSNVALFTVLTALVQIATQDTDETMMSYIEDFNSTYQFLMEREDLGALPD